jgi:hypothetical protein
MDQAVIYFYTIVCGIMVGLTWADWATRQRLTKDLHELKETWRNDLLTLQKVHNSVIEQMQLINERLSAQEARAFSVLNNQKPLHGRPS